MNTNLIIIAYHKKVLVSDGNMIDYHINVTLLSYLHGTPRYLKEYHCVIMVGNMRKSVTAWI